MNSEYWLNRSDHDPKVINIQYDNARIRISDTGNGIDSSVEKNLFEPFITLKPKSQGRGLGLFISRQILDSMGCTISLLNKRNSKGNRYIFELDLSGIHND